MGDDYVAGLDVGTTKVRTVVARPETDGVGAISETEDKVTAIKGSKNQIRSIDPDICIRCGLCIETCPPNVKAILKVSPVKGGDA